MLVVPWPSHQLQDHEDVCVLVYGGQHNPNYQNVVKVRSCELRHFDFKTPASAFIGILLNPLFGKNTKKERTKNRDELDHFIHFV